MKKFPILQGYHFGASELYYNNEKITIEKEDGSISRLEGLHVVDATVLDSIPSFSPTITIFVNAHRIAEKICKKMY